MLTDRQKHIYRTIAQQPGHGEHGIALRHLAALTGQAVNTLRADLATMVKLGWIEIRPGERRRSCFRLCDPVRRQEVERLEKLMLQLKHAPYRGEALLKAILDIIVADTRFVDNARPPFLTNPITGLPLEYDRYYPDRKVAIEFNGSQHEQPTDRFPNHDSRLVRDLIKEALSARAGVTLLVFRPSDLRLSTIVKMVRPHLPLRSISATDPAIPFIEECTRAYRARAVPALTPPSRTGSMATNSGV